MNDFQYMQQSLAPFMPFLVILIIWEAVWKLIAMWRAARNGQLAWFICMALINTAGILPIVYLLIHKKK